MTKQELHEKMEKITETMIAMGWLEEGLTEKQLDTVCGACPFGGCGDHCYACPCWEESAGWDV